VAKQAVGKEVCKIPDRPLESASTRSDESFLPFDFGKGFCFSRHF
jgi:hypothetical protein